MNDSSVLDAIRPTVATRIMDVVAAAGIDVSPWSRRADGSVTESPQKNPHYCYEWAFGGSGEPTALCVWHRLLTVEDGVVSYTDNYRETALLLDRASEDRFQPPSTKSRARDQAKRARRFDLSLPHSFRRSEPVRVITLVGNPRRLQSGPGIDASKVEFRMLDPEPWYVQSYSDNDGLFRMVRGIPLAKSIEATSSRNTSGIFLDQFSLHEPLQRQETTGLVYPRSAEVRGLVLQRAAGFCEHCGLEGSKTSSGGIYLETHHVIPLSEEGPDVEWNVVAICAHDHRRAHHAHDRESIRVQLVEHLVRVFPQAQSRLRTR